MYKAMAASFEHIVYYTVETVYHRCQISSEGALDQIRRLKFFTGYYHNNTTMHWRETFLQTENFLYLARIRNSQKFRPYEICSFYSSILHRICYIVYRLQYIDYSIQHIVYYIEYTIAYTTLYFFNVTGDSLPLFARARTSNYSQCGIQFTQQGSPHHHDVQQCE